MNRFFLILTTIFALLLGACNVNIDPAEGDVDITGTIPATVDSRDTLTDTVVSTDTVTLTDTLATTDTTDITTTGVTTTAMATSSVMTETEDVDTEDVITETAGETATTEVDTTPTPVIEPTATLTAAASSATTTDTVTATQQMTTTEMSTGAAMTGTASMTDTTSMTDTGSMSDTETTTGADMTMLPDTSNMTIAEVVQSLDEFSTLESAVEAAGVGDAFTVEGPITVFAPANGAFDAIPADQLQALLDDPALLAEILQYHIVIDSADSAELARLNAAQSTSGQPIAISVGLDGEVFVNDAQIVFADIQTANGIIHVVNQVLIPPTLDLEVPAADPNTIEIRMQPADDTLEELSAADTSDQTIVEVVNSISGLSTAATAIDAAGLTDVLEQPGPFTLFVPTDPAFAELPNTQLADLLNDTVALANMLQYHLVLDTVTSGDLAVLPTLLTASGETLTVTVEENGRIFINGAPVYQADIEAANGIIHVVGEIITPLPEE